MTPLFTGTTPFDNPITPGHKGLVRTRVVVLRRLAVIAVRVVVGRTLVLELAARRLKLLVGVIVVAVLLQ
jgi:hypothetical protein